MLSVRGGTIEVESSRYPFCHFGDSTDIEGTRSILPHIPFQDELNRFDLVVAGFPSDDARVTWGHRSIVVDRLRLEHGLNLADAFLANPFSGQFAEVRARVDEKQKYESNLMRSITNFSAINQLFGDGETREASDVIIKKLRDRHTEMHNAVRSAITPLVHTIHIEPL